MKKKISLLILILMLLVISCSKKEKLSVAATAVPHAEILEFLKPKMAEKGYDLEVMVVGDVVVGNNALREKSVDANFLEHRGTLERYVKEQKVDFEEVVGVILIPFGIYSKEIKNLSEIKNGSEVVMPTIPANQGRTFKLLESVGLLKFKEGVVVETSTLQEFDKIIASNPKNLKFRLVHPTLLPQIYNNKDGDLVAINANYALQAGLNPSKDALMVENLKNSSRFVNLLVTHKSDEEKPAIKALAELLKSKDVKDFIEKKYKGQVIPTNE